jgi:hypothetical protein
VVPDRWEDDPRNARFENVADSPVVTTYYGEETIKASTLEPLTTTAVRGRHLTLDDDTLLGSHPLIARGTTGGWQRNLVERNEAVWRAWATEIARALKIGRASVYRAVAGRLDNPRG